MKRMYENPKMTVMLLEELDVIVTSWGEVEFFSELNEGEWTNSLPVGKQ